MKTWIRRDNKLEQLSRNDLFDYSMLCSIPVKAERAGSTSAITTEVNTSATVKTITPYGTKLPLVMSRTRIILCIIKQAQFLQLC